VILGSVGTPPCSARPPDADCISADSGGHTLGALHFARDGRSSSESRTEPMRLSLIRIPYAQDLNSPNGKILRIRPDGSAPSDNPFHDGTNSWRSRVWQYGVRNPSGSRSIRRPRKSTWATSVGTPGRRSTTAPPRRTSAGRATRGTVRSRPTGASSRSVPNCRPAR
jgi:glucose/arabinose dehydrogenase